MRLLRKIIKYSLVTTLLIVVISAILYASAPNIVSYLSPTIAKRLGVDSIEIEIEHPGLAETKIRRLVVNSDRLHVSAGEILAVYTIRELLDGRLISLDIAQLNVALSSGDTSGPASSPADLLPTILHPPVGELNVRKLDLQMADSGFIGTGRASLGAGTLEFHVEGIAPEVASRFFVQATLNADGEFQARFGDQAAAEVQFAELKGTVGDNEFNIEGNVLLHGFALQLASEFAGVPSGDGNLDAEFRVALPWPLPDTTGWQQIDVDVPAFLVDWRSTDKAIQLRKIAGRAEIRGGSVESSQSGTMTFRWPERKVTVSMPKEYGLTYRDHVLVGQAGLAIRLEEGGNDIRTTLHSFRYRNGESHDLDFDADIAAVLPALEANGTATGNVILTTLDPLAASSEFRFNGKLATETLDESVSLQANADLKADDLVADGTFSAAMLQAVPFKLAYQLENGSGKFEAQTQLDIRKPFAASAIKSWTAEYDLDAGSVAVSLLLDWQSMDLVAAQLTLLLENGRAHYADNTASGLAGEFKLTASDVSRMDTWTLAPAAVTVAEVDIGLPITDISFLLAWSGDTATARNFRGDVLGGRVLVDSVTYAIEAGNADFPALLEDVDLAELLLLEGDLVAGNGRLGGTLPVSIKQGQISIANGLLSAAPPGGKIQLQSSFGGISGQPGLDFALTALNDFEYSELSAKVDYSESGDLELGLQLKGRNPAVEKGRAIVYNVNVTENIPVLLESLRLTDKLGQKIEKGLEN